MNETIQLGEISIVVTRKAIKNVHLSVHPPNGRVTLVGSGRNAPGSCPRLRDLKAGLDSRSAVETRETGA